MCDFFYINVEWKNLNLREIYISTIILISTDILFRKGPLLASEEILENKENTNSKRKNKWKKQVGHSHSPHDETGEANSSLQWLYSLS